MDDAPIFTSEAEFREWFEKDPARYGVKRIILSQEPCPDYVVEMMDGKIAKIEAELFAVNFKYHGHDPAKVDYILACYAKEEQVAGVPVIACNNLSCYDVEPREPLPPEGPLSEIEADLLNAVGSSGGISICALSQGSFAGDQEFWLRFPPEKIAQIPRGNIGDGLLNVMSQKTKEWLKKYHHVLIAADLSIAVCRAIEQLDRRGLIRYSPMDFLSAAYDGAIIDHPAWLPTEIRVTEKARELHSEIIRRWS
jgi:hypothetical protein